MISIRFQCVVAIFVLSLLASNLVADTDRPNFLIIMADDCTYNNLPEGPRYPIRSVTDGKSRYFRNLLPDEIYIEKHLMGGGRLNNPYWATWVGADPLKQRDVYERVKRYMRRPAEQLYLTAEDPYELRNVAGDAAFSATKAKLSAALDAWLTSQGDPGAAVDTVEALQAARRGQHLHGPAISK